MSEGPGQLDGRGAFLLLLKHEHLDPSHPPTQRVQIWRRDGRHTSFRIHVGDEHGFFIKQGNGRTALGTVFHEFKMLEMLSREAGLQQYLPKTLGYDAHDDALIAALPFASVDLRTALRGEKAVPTADVLAWLGVAIARLHSVAVRKSDLNAPNHEPPWVLSLGRPRASLRRELSAGNLDLIRMLQGEPHLIDRLAQLRLLWQQRALIHFDIRFENIVLATDSLVMGKETYIVDWEFSALGDPRWDIACVLADCMALWVRSVVADKGALNPEPDLSTATKPLVAFHASIKAFWQSYRGVIDGKDEMLETCISLAGARLIQLAYEMTQGHRQLSLDAAHMLQAGSNLVCGEGPCGRELLGLDGQ